MIKKCLFCKPVVLSMLTLFLFFQATAAFSFAPAPPPPPPAPEIESVPPPVIVEYAPGGKGYRGYIMTDTGHKQPFLHLEGNGYEMGYQQGYLIPQKCADVASKEFFTSIAVSNLGRIGLTEDVLVKPVVELLLEQFFGQTLADYPNMSVMDVGLFVFKHIAVLNEPFIPKEYIDEMHGIADGARARGVNLTYQDVLLLNVGFDAFLSAGYPIITTTTLLTDLLNHLQLSCNAFVLDGNATLGNNLFMGRDFMFGGEGFSDNPVIIETCGSKRNRVVSVSVAGMVGSPAAMNDKGLAIGMDMVPSADCTPGLFGMGCLITARYAMEHANELDQAISLINKSTRGVSWLYVIADGQGAHRGGVSLEVSAHFSFTRDLDYSLGWLASQLAPVQQKENYPDALIQTNHYITPDMHAVNPTFQDSGSVSRYDSMIDLLNRDYGTYDFDKAFDFINWMYKANGEGPSNKVHQSTTLFDLTHMKMKALAGPTFGDGASTLILK